MVVKYVAAACAGVLIATSPALAESAPVAEVISSEANDTGVNITVPTGGCTSKADFEVSTHPGTGGVTDVQIRRLKPDRCKGNFPAGIKLQFTWGDLKVPAGTRLAVTNPVEARTTVLAKQHREVKPVKKKRAKRCLRSKYGKHGCAKPRARRHVHRMKPSMRHAYRYHRRHHHRIVRRHHWWCD